jgi:hypothetical protein
MEPTATIPRNLLIGAGAYYLAEWLTVPLAIAFGMLTQRMVYTGDFESAVVVPLVTYFPKAVVAFAAGVVVVRLVQSDRPIAWVAFPALLYAILGFFGYHWMRPPELLDRVQQTVSALFPAVACVLGAVLADRQRPKSPASNEAFPQN